MEAINPADGRPVNWFVTGTDTGCGKTTVTAALARALVSRGIEVACFKPIASGCRRDGERLVNDDALALIEASNVVLPYRQVNPYALELAIAPHIAAEIAGIRFDLARIVDEIEACRAPVRLIEGVGGWRVPLDYKRCLPELPRLLGCRILLVVGMRLGCLNHALLTARAVIDDGLELAGWIANRLDPAFEQPEANERTLEAMLPAPRLGAMKPSEAGPKLEISDRLERLFST